MNGNGSPANVGSNAGLGPLPEPAAMTTSYEVVPAGQGSAMHPGGTLRACGRVAVGYTADQMRAYAAAEAARAVAAERERIAAAWDGCVYERRVRRPRVTTLQRDEDAFQGLYKQHELDLLRSGDHADWYIRVRHPDGCYVYDGWWPESCGRNVDDAVAEACRGAGLWTPNLGIEARP